MILIFFATIILAESAGVLWACSRLINVRSSTNPTAAWVTWGGCASILTLWAELSYALFPLWYRDSSPLGGIDALGKWGLAWSLLLGPSFTSAVGLTLLMPVKKSISIQGLLILVSIFGITLWPGSMVLHIGASQRNDRRQAEQLVAARNTELENSDIEFNRGLPLTDDDRKYLSSGSFKIILAPPSFSNDELMSIDVTSLEIIHLQGTKVTDIGLERLANALQLRVLYLQDTAVSDRGIAFLSNLSNLEYINLRNTKITDASVDALEKLPKLERLVASGTQVTPGRLSRFTEMRGKRSKIQP